MKPVFKKLSAAVMALAMISSLSPVTGGMLMADETETEAPAATEAAEETEKPVDETTKATETPEETEKQEAEPTEETKETEPSEPVETEWKTVKFKIRVK